MTKKRPPSASKVTAKQKTAQASPPRAESQDANTGEDFMLLGLEGDLRGLEAFARLQRDLESIEADLDPGEGISLDLMDVSALGAKQAALIGIHALKWVSAGRPAEFHVRPGVVAAELLPFLGLAAELAIQWDDSSELLVVSIPKASPQTSPRADA